LYPLYDVTSFRLLSASAALVLTAAMIPMPLAAQQQIYWGDSVPDGWNGKWPAELRTYAEQSDFTRTMTTAQLHEYVNTLRWKSDRMHVLSMFTSPLGKVAPAMVLSNPRVTSPEEARASKKNVVFLLGNIHPPEPEAAEALLLVARELLLGKSQSLLDNQIVIIAPIYNVDGTDAISTNDGSLGSVTPVIQGQRENSQGLDLNRDGVKLTTVEANGLYRTLNEWDPILLLDGHLMSRVNHGYANTYGSVTVPAANPGLRTYLDDTIFPVVRDMVREQFGLEVFTHALFGREWPPKAWSHDLAAWTVDAKFLVNDFGLRNRFAIITETPGQPTLERRVYAQYAYIMALLEYTNTHAAEMRAAVEKADSETVQNVLDHAESGTLMNYLDGEYHSRGKVPILAYRTNVEEYLPGTSVLGTKRGTASGKPETVMMEDLTLSVGTRQASVPRAYILPASLADIAAKLRAHNIKVRTLDEPLRAEGEAFIISKVGHARRRGYDMTTLDGEFTARQVREFPAGSFFVDMAQPMANAAFYYLEPQARDGFVGWGVLDDRLQPGEYPIFKFRREAR
jgi:hypothetical protein